MFYLYHSKFIFLLSGFWYINWVLASSIGINSPPFPFLYDKSFLQRLPATLMSRRSSKGKRKASPLAPAPLSSDESDTALNEHHPTKKPRLSSPARVRQAAMVKVESTSKSGSSSKGMAGFAALINSTSLSAARKETNQGLRSGSSSKRSGSQSKAGRVV